MSAGWVLIKIFQHLIVMYVFFSDTSTGKSSRREQSWTPAWVCATLRPATEHCFEGECFPIVLEPGTIDLDVHVDLANILMLHPLSDRGIMAAYSVNTRWGICLLIHMSLTSYCFLSNILVFSI